MAQMKAYEHIFHKETLNQHEIANMAPCEQVLFTVWQVLVTLNAVLNRHKLAIVRLMGGC
jgi:hypothetical protein